jgi:hypothetical protein
MTCPTFSDRDEATRDMMGPPDSKEYLRAAMRVSTDPRWVKQQLSPVELPRPIPAWRIVAAFILAALLVVIVISVARAEPPRLWVVWNETTDQPWLSKKGEPATATGPTACNLSLWEVAKAAQDGTRLSCRRIDSTKGE